MNICVNKLLFQVLELSSSDVTCMLAVLPPIVPSLEEIPSQQMHMHGQPKFEAIICEPCSYYDSASVPKWPQKQY